MLVLSRYRDESIYIGDDIVITVVDVRGDRVRLGIEAPPNVSVHRQEIYNAIQEERKAASKTAPPVEQRAQGLPVEIDTPGIGFGGISDIVPR